MAKRKNRDGVVGTVSGVADRAAEVAISVSDRAAELVEQALITSADAAKTVGETVSNQLKPDVRGRTTVGSVVSTAAKTVAQQNRKLVRAESKVAKRATKTTAKTARKARRLTTKAARRASSAASSATKTIRSGASRAAKSATSTAKRAAKTARTAAKRSTTKRSKKR